MSVKEREQRRSNAPSSQHDPSERHKASHPDLMSIQRAAGNRAVTEFVQRDEGSASGAGGQVRSVLGASGAPLNSQFRARAESFLGADFSQVRIHTGGTAARSADAVGASAYTS